jgi:hypothetical protein
MLKRVLPLVMATFSSLSNIGDAAAQQVPLPNLGGTYRCDSAPVVCRWAGATYSVPQSGNTLEFKSGDVGQSSQTSNFAISAGLPSNMLENFMTDNVEIQWSKGRDWAKQ